MTLLSLLARIGVALNLFHGYCHRRGLNHREIDSFVDHLWDFIAIPSSGGEFETWLKNEPPLAQVGLGDELPPGFDSVLSAAAVSEVEFRQVLVSTTEVIYTSMYAAADEKWSRHHLLELASVAESVGADWPDMSCFKDFKWSDCNGWGQQPSEQELAQWRGASRD